MIKSGHNRHRLGVTLIELLCVMGIIAILASLLLGPVSRAMRRARAMQWSEDARILLERTVEQMQARLRGKIDFPTVTLGQIETNGWLGPAQIAFLKDRRVTFTPFSGKDPDDMVVILVRIDPGFLTQAGFIGADKGIITRLPQ